MKVLVIGLISIIWVQNAFSAPKWSFLTSGDSHVDDYGLPLTDYDFLDMDLSFGNGTVFTDIDYGMNMDYGTMDMDYGYLAFRNSHTGDSTAGFSPAYLGDSPDLNGDEPFLSSMKTPILVLAAIAVETVILRAVFSFKPVRKMKRNLVNRMRQIISAERRHKGTEKKVLPKKRCVYTIARPVMPDSHHQGPIPDLTPPSDGLELLRKVPKSNFGADARNGQSSTENKMATPLNAPSPLSPTKTLVPTMEISVPETPVTKEQSRDYISTEHHGEEAKEVKPKTSSYGTDDKPAVTKKAVSDVTEKRKSTDTPTQLKGLETPTKIKLGIPFIAQKLAQCKDPQAGFNGKTIAVPDIRERLKLKNQPERGILNHKGQDIFPTQVIPKNFTDYGYVPGTPVTVEAKTLDGAFSLSWNSHASFRDPESDSKTQTVFQFRPMPTLGVKIPDPDLDYFGQAEAPKCRTRKVRFSNAVTVKTLICEEESSYVPKILAKSMKVTEIVEVHRLHNGRGRATMRRLEAE